MPTRVLLTGAAGFAGSHCLRHLLVNTGWDFVLPVSFRHRGVPDRIVLAAQPSSTSLYQDDYMKRVQVVYWDLNAPIDPVTAQKIGHIDFVINYASESHVDRSIADPAPFITNNVRVITNLLDWARQQSYRPTRIYHVSTDEVYGPARDGYAHKEWDPVIPSNPYSASKAAQEAICTAYWRTYGLPIVILNSMNLFGETQDPEKFIPMVIRKVLREEPVPIHGTQDQIGSRCWLHARNLADAILHLIWCCGASVYGVDNADRPDRYHVVGPEYDNLSVAEMVAAIVGKPLKPQLVDFHSGRPGHDRRYALDGTKLAEAGWKPQVPFGPSLEMTVRWTLEHSIWLHQ